MTRSISLTLALFVLGTAVCLGAEPHPLIGTWKRIAGRDSKDGEWQPMPAEVTMLKHITGTHVSWSVFRNETNEILAAMGGAITIDGDKYVESVDHGLGNILQLQGQKQNFTWKVEGNKFTQAGTLSNGQYLEEQFERVVPQKAK